MAIQSSVKRVPELNRPMVSPSRSRGGFTRPSASTAISAVVARRPACSSARVTAKPTSATTALIAVLALGLALGVLTESAQAMLGGSLSVGDIGRDLLGCAVGFCVTQSLGAARLRAASSTRIASP